MHEAGSTVDENNVVLEDGVRKQVFLAGKSGRLPVVITGETGTGKEIVANAIWTKRCREFKVGPFVVLNCAGMDENLAGSMLCGYKRGSFTGADKDNQGYFEAADQGVLFLDEIHTLSIESQRRLLRVLNDGSFQRIGETQVRYTNFQVVAATTENLDDNVDSGKFLPDLRNRLIGVEIFLKPLRERFDELSNLINCFLKQRQIQVGNMSLRRLVERCKMFYWQGNVRLLFRVLEHMAQVAAVEERALGDVELPVFQSMHPPRGRSKPDGKGEAKVQVPASFGGYPGDQIAKLKPAVRQFEKKVISQALLAERSIGEAARVLGISRSCLDAKRKRYNLL